MRNQEQLVLLIKQLAKFGAVGALNTFVGVSVIFGCMYLLNLSPIISNLSGYSVGLCISFILNSRWTFKSQANKTTIFGFLFAYLCSYSANLALLAICLNIGIDDYVSQMVGVLVFSVSFFLMNKFFVFSKNS